MSSHELALALRVPATRINDIVNEKRGITADTALRLSRYFGYIQVLDEHALVGFLGGDLREGGPGPRGAEGGLFPPAFRWSWQGKAVGLAHPVF